VSEAIALHERSLADKLEVLGQRHADSLKGLSGLALSYWTGEAGVRCDHTAGMGAHRVG
jgi:hypothetical protein